MALLGSFEVPEQEVAAAAAAMNKDLGNGLCKHSCAQYPDNTKSLINPARGGGGRGKYAHVDSDFHNLHEDGRQLEISLFTRHSTNDNPSLDECKGGGRPAEARQQNATSDHEGQSVRVIAKNVQSVLADDQFDYV